MFRQSCFMKGSDVIGGKARFREDYIIFGKYRADQRKATDGCREGSVARMMSESAGWGAGARPLIDMSWKVGFLVPQEPCA
jgi:hypothetical protein